jgi:hypothetical protein
VRLADIVGHLRAGFEHQELVFTGFIRYLSRQIVDDVAVLISGCDGVSTAIAFGPAEFVRFAFNEDERRILLVVDRIRSRPT